jgi:hypothetical protein
VTINENRLLSPYQSGFRSDHITATALLKITNDIQHDCDRRLVMLFLLQLKKLSLHFKFGGTVVGLVGSYLSDRFQCVSVGGILLGLIALTRGVVQGSVLGPLIFSIFIYERYFCPDRLLSIS